jgi:hypothetical protein
MKVCGLVLLKTLSLMEISLIEIEFYRNQNMNILAGQIKMPITFLA